MKYLLSSFLLNSSIEAFLNELFEIQMLIKKGYIRIVVFLNRILVESNDSWASNSRAAGRMGLALDFVGCEVYVDGMGWEWSGVEW